MFKHLNDAQKQAVTAPLGPTLVIAGPGSGKTQVIIHRIDYMIQHLACKPENILVITFSKAAAVEMQTRFMKRFHNKCIQFGTFHAIFYRILRSFDPYHYQTDNLLQEEEKKRFIQQIYQGMPQEEYEDFVEQCLKHMTLMNNQLIHYQYYEPEGISAESYRFICEQYNEYKTQQNVFDFDDILVDCYKLLTEQNQVLSYYQNRYRYILVDEFQDVNLAQFETLKLLIGESAQIFVVGDDDQSIYRFRGSKPEFLLHFHEHFPNPKKIILNTNYRSTQNILQYSEALIKHNKTRYIKNMCTYNEIGQIPSIITCKDAKEQGMFILHQISKQKEIGESFHEMAIIYRTNAQARLMAQLLLHANIPFCLKEHLGTLYDQWITKDILAYLKLAQNRNQKELIHRIMNRPKRYISKKVLEEVSNQEDILEGLLAHEGLNSWQKDGIQALLFHLQCLQSLSFTKTIEYIRHTIGYDNYITDYAAYRKLPIVPLKEMLSEIQESMQDFENVWDWELFLQETGQNLKRQRRSPIQEGVTLTTMHGCKGLEFNNVYIIDVIDGIIPHAKSLSITEIEEERRLFYVAMTRAKKQLILYIPKERYGESVEASPFLQEMANTLFKQRISPGKVLFHKKYGRGKIVDCDENGVITIEFERGIKRKIDSQYCTKHDIITWEE